MTFVMISKSSSSNEINCNVTILLYCMGYVDYDVKTYNKKIIKYINGTFEIIEWFELSRAIKL